MCLKWGSIHPQFGSFCPWVPLYPWVKRYSFIFPRIKRRFDTIHLFQLAKFLCLMVHIHRIYFCIMVFGDFSMVSFSFLLAMPFHGFKWAQRALERNIIFGLCLIWRDDVRQHSSRTRMTRNKNKKKTSNLSYVKLNAHTSCCLFGPTRSFFFCQPFILFFLSFLLYSFLTQCSFPSIARATFCS